MCASTTSAPALHCEKQFALLPQCNYTPHVRLHRICTSITLPKAIMPGFPQCNYARHNFKGKILPTVPRSPSTIARRECRQRASQTTHFHERARSDFLWKHRDSHASLLSTCILSHACHTNCNLLTEPPHDWAIQLAELPLDQAFQLWATSGWLYLLTALFNGELPLDWSTTIQLDRAIQVWAISWLLYF